MTLARKPRIHTARHARVVACAGTVLLAVGAARAELVVQGLRPDLEANVRAHSPLATTGCDSARWRVERLFRDADGPVREALEAFGYYDPVIHKTLTWGEDCWQASFEIAPGEPVLYRRVDIGILGEAASDQRFLSRLAEIRPTEGAVLDHSVYTGFKASLQRSADHSGYFDAGFDYSRISVDRAAGSADLELRFVSGSRYRFDEVSFSDGILRPDLLARYTDIRPGDPYSANAINELYEALSGSGYFETVSIRTEPLDSEARTVPVDVVLTPAKRRVYSIGGGYTTDNGPHARLGYSDRRVNDRGHQFDSRLYASTVRTEVNLAYRWPREDPRNDWFSVVAGYQHEQTDTNHNDTYKLGVLRSHKLNANWLATRYLDYAHEDFRIADQRSTSQLVIGGLNWESAIGRELRRAANGYRLSFDIRGASDALGSDTNFLQFRGKAKWIHSFTNRSRVIARTSIGATLKDELSELPASVRFFAGGDRSVRGYGYESLGPVNADGDVIGGSHLIDGSLEFDVQFRESWAVAAFVDSGSAFNATGVDFSTGVGLGLRWYSPVGPIRLDFAHPLDDPDTSLRVHISLGPDL